MSERQHPGPVPAPRAGRDPGRDPGPNPGTDPIPDSGPDGAAAAAAAAASDLASARLRLRLEEDLFFRASALPPAEREAAITAWTPGDAALRSHLLALLAGESRIAEQIAAAGPDPAGERGQAGRRGEDPALSWIGRQVGPFHLDRLLGRGGMGVVYLAHRNRGELRQSVAVKLIAASLDLPPAVRQFESERDLLARLSHPHIARLIDAGLTGDGVPYVAMEFIDGRPLDAVLADPSIESTAKLGLFLDLCDAVEYIHASLVLHRDLKPNNVLVTAGGNLKLLDFGIAKMVGSDDGALTRAGLHPIARRYASPESIAGETLSTAADVYSLGAMLSLWIHGTPHPAGAEEGDPSLAPAGSAPLPAAGQLPQRMRRELEAIVRKAMRPAPRDRYPAVQALGADLRAALASRRTSARRYAPLDSARLFAHRHRGALAAVSLLLLLLFAGTAALAYQTMLNRREINRNLLALGEQEKLIHLLLFNFFDSLKAIPGSTSTQRATLAQALGYLDNLTRSGDANDSPALEQDAVAAYTELGSLQGSPYEENLGDTRGAIQTLEKAVRLAQKLADSAPGDVDRRQSLADAEVALGRAYFGQGDPRDAAPHLLHADALGEQIAGSARASAAQIAAAGGIADMLGDLYGLPGSSNLGDPVRARAAYSRAEALHALGAARYPGCDRCRRGLVVEEWKTARTWEDDDPGAALLHLERALAAEQRIPAAERRAARFLRLDNVVRNALGAVQLELGRPQQAIATLVPPYQHFTEAIERDPMDSRARYDRLILGLDCGRAWNQLGQPKRALALLSLMLEDADSLLRNDPANPQLLLTKARILILLAATLKELRQPLSARSRLGEGVRLAMTVAENKQPSPEAMDLLADTLLASPDAVPHGLELARQYGRRDIALSGSPTLRQRQRLQQIDRALSLRPASAPARSR